jgi:hypothetical protein
VSTDRDTTRIVRSWLRSDDDESADRLLDAVLDALDTTPQRRHSWLARRSPIMNNSARLIATAAAVVVGALIGYQLLIAPSVGGPEPAPIESSSATPTTTPPPSVGTGNGFPPPGPVEAGTRYAVSASPTSIAGAVSYSFVVPTSAWLSDRDVVGISARGYSAAADASVWFFDNYALFESNGQVPMIPAVLNDPCVHDGLQSRSFEASLAGQAEAIASIPGTELVSGPSAVTVDSRPGQEVTIAFPDDLGCTRQEFWLLFNQSEGPGVFYPNWAGETLHVWLIDVDGEIFTIWTQVRPGDASTALEAEIQQIVDSIQFE